MDNFVEIEIKQKKRFRTVLIKQGLMFDLYAWFLLWQHFGWNFDTIGTKAVDELQSGMVYTGALSYNRYKGIRKEFTIEDCEKWIDELPVRKMKEISKVLMESTKILEPLKAAGESKKK